MTELFIGVNIACLITLGWRAWYLEGKLAEAAADADRASEEYDAGIAMNAGVIAVLRRENFLLTRRNVQITNELRGSDDRARTVALPDARPSPVQWAPESWQKTTP